LKSGRTVESLAALRPEHLVPAANVSRLGKRDHIGRRRCCGCSRYRWSVPIHFFLCPCINVSGLWLERVVLRAIMDITTHSSWLARAARDARCQGGDQNHSSRVFRCGQPDRAAVFTVPGTTTGRSHTQT